MKIILVTNKTYRGQVDFGYWNTLLPLRYLGHDVTLFDTSSTPTPNHLGSMIDKIKPDLIFCCMTGDNNITPNEPWECILKETTSGRTKTFNWFCDDTWRFDNFSSKVCGHFNVCSTPEPTYIKRFKDIGYDNIILGNWHCNLDIFKESVFKEKSIDCGFVGFLTDNRKDFFRIVDKKGIKVDKFHGLSHDEMLAKLVETKVGINLSTNDNDPEKKTQMKLRMFEVPASKAMLISEFHPGIEQFYDIDKEIITFKTIPEFVDKMKFLNNNASIVEKIALNGHERFIKEHESKTRLKSVLEGIMRC
jgi:spore maturation protein CgeB